MASIVSGGGPSLLGAGAPPNMRALINTLDMFGHSFTDNPMTGTSTASLEISDQYNFGLVFSQAIGLSREVVRNHGMTGSQLTSPGRGGVNGPGGGFAKCLSEIVKTTVTYPFGRNGGCYLFVYGINDIGNNTPANQTLLGTTAFKCYTALISKCRASAVYLANGGAPWSLGSNFSAAPVVALDYTSGNAANATVVDASGTTTATFTIPLGYQGEPICFNMVGLSGSATMTVTWGGTVTGTTGIVGRTDTLSASVLNAQGPYPVRFTGPVNGLTKANAGQTITVRLTTNSGGGTWTLDGAWIESWKPCPVLVCNVARLPETTMSLELGDGVTTGVTTSFTSASAAFLSSTDAGQSISEIDAQGALPAGLTVASVTNATTIVLSGNANLAATGIKYLLARRVRGYSSGTYYTANTDFTSATPSNKAAADADVLAWNAQVSSAIAQFDSMVQLVDIDSALGQGDRNLPANLYSFVDTDGVHPNTIGHIYMAQAVWSAASALAENTTDFQPLGTLEVLAVGGRYPGPKRNPVISGSVYLPEGGPVSNTIVYTPAAGDLWAFPIFVTEGTEFWVTCYIQSVAASTIAVRCGWYDDNNTLGYPQQLKLEPTASGATALTLAANTVGTVGTFNRPIHYGLNWLVLKIDSLTTAGSLVSQPGPNPYVPSGLSTLFATGYAPIAWKLTGQAAGALPNNFPTGGVATGNSITSASSAPAFAISKTLQ